MDTVKIENIFKEWQDKSMLTKKGALQVDPIFLSIIRSVFLRGGGYCLSLIIFVPVFLSTLHFFSLYWALRKGKQIDSLDRFFSMLSKSSDAFEKILYPLVEPLLLPILCFNPILLFHKDHLVVSSGWIGRKEKCYYSDVEKSRIHN